MTPMPQAPEIAGEVHELKGETAQGNVLGTLAVACELLVKMKALPVENLYEDLEVWHSPFR
jgi:hypothetical protein